MAIPGPSAALWAVELVALATALLPLGDLARTLLAERVGWFRTGEPLERLLLDLYLAGALLYLIESVPGGVELPLTPAVAIAAGAAGWIVRRRLRGRRPDPSEPLRVPAAARVPLALAGASGATVYGLEMALAAAAATGNTFDSSVLAIFTGLAQLHHQLPTSFLPVAPLGVAYPQGTTSWLLTAGSLGGLPWARAPLLLTPLFLGLVPLAGYVWAARWWESPWAGAAVAVGLASLTSWTRLLVSGSNDFAAAVPLLLLLWSKIPLWGSARPPGWGDAVGFGVLAGYSAALNPVGAELLFPGLVLWTLLARPRLGGDSVAWIARWAGALGVALVAVLPSLATLWAGRGNPHLLPGAPVPLSPPLGAFPLPTIVGYFDPFLFQPGNQLLSPFPELRIELALLLVAGLVWLYFLPAASRRRTHGEERLRRFLPVQLLATGLLLGAADLGRAGVRSFSGLLAVTSVEETAVLLFLVYGLVALLPLVLAFDSLSPRTRGASPEPFASDGDSRGHGPPPVPPRPLRPDRSARGLALTVALLVLLPALAATATELPPYVAHIYTEYGNVTEADFALLSWAGSHLPNGARVLVAPGSAAQFLPADRPDLALVFPVLAVSDNATYQSVVAALDAGRLTVSDRLNLTALQVGYIAVTQRNTVLWPGFNPAPLLSDPAGFPVQFHQGDAYVFAVLPGR